MKFPIGLNYWVLGGFEGTLPPIKAIDESAKMKANALELTFGDALKESITKEQCQQIVSHSKGSGVELLTLSTGKYWNTSLSSDDPKERFKAIEFTQRYMEVASWLNIHKILIVPASVDVAWDESRPVVSYKNAWGNSMKSLHDLEPFAKKHDVIIGLENVWNKFLLSPMEWKYYLKELNSDFIGMYFDAGNVIINGYPEHWIEILHDEIIAIQVKNFQRLDAGGTLSGFTDDLQKGDFNFTNFIQSIKENAFPKASQICPIIAEMIPFCRLPNMKLPDIELAEDTVKKMKLIFN